jgi:gliding motility associated protien GldN
MKYIVSLMLGGLLFTGSLNAQNLANNSPRILDEIAVVTGTAEDDAGTITTRELALMENSMNDYSTTVWSREIYRQIGAGVKGNETFFNPAQSTGDNINLFSMIINLVSTSTVPIYKYTAQPDMSDENRLTGTEALRESVIPFQIEGGNKIVVKKEDIPSASIKYYLVKERWYFDTKTSKGDIRVTHICPVLFEKGRYYPLFWVSFDDLSVYLQRTPSSLEVSNIKPVLSNVSMFDVIRSRYYRGCIYQVGLRHLSVFFPTMEGLIKERERIEDELDYIQTKFYDALRRR